MSDHHFKVADREGNEWIFGTYHPLAGDLVYVDSIACRIVGSTMCTRSPSTTN